MLEQPSTLRKRSRIFRHEKYVIGAVDEGGSTKNTTSSLLMRHTSSLDHCDVAMISEERLNRCCRRNRRLFQSSSFLLLISLCVINQRQAAAFQPSPWGLRSPPSFIFAPPCRSFPSALGNVWTKSTTTLFDSEVETLINGNGTESALHHNMRSIDGISMDKNGASASTETDVADVPLPTENGGYTHTQASKAKISAANKGKTPWNKGRTRSPEERARIAEGVRAKNRERFQEKLKSMNMTEAEWEEQKLAEKRKKQAERAARRTEKGGYRPTEETRQKISRILKEKHARGEVKRSPVHPSKIRKGFTHSEETRRKISESLRKRWATDEGYRQNMIEKNTAANTREQTRRKISETLRKKWQDPEFRQNMLETMANRTSPARDESHKERISQAMKLKWQDEEYRKKTLESIAKRKKVRDANRPAKPKKQPRRAAVKKATPRVVAKRTTPRTIVDHSGSPSFSTTNTKINGSKDLVSFGEDDEDDDEDDDEETSLAYLTHRKSKVRGQVAAMAPLQPLSPTTKKKKKKVKKTKKKTTTAAPPIPSKEVKADGSVSRLREERRDLYDLLYGDEDESSRPAANSRKMNRLAGIFELGDENLDTFDPYGLDDF